MRTILQLILVCGVLSLGALPAHASQPTTGKPEGLGLDTIRNRAVKLLTANLEFLKDPYKHGEFKKAYSPGAKHYCDHCRDPKPEDIANYISSFPRGLEFTYELHTDRIKSKKVELGEYELEVPYRKRLPRIDASGVDPGRTHWVDLVAHMHFDYNTGSFQITNVLQESAPGVNVLMVEASPIFGLGSLKYDDLGGTAPTSQSLAASVGLMYYFNPFGGTNRNNIWLKIGLRGGSRRTKLNIDGLVFSRSNVELVPTASSLAFPMRENIDVMKTVNGLEETATSTVLEVPIGLSKRWKISHEITFSLELEAGYGFEVSRKVKGDYAVDQVGTDHRIFIGTVDQNGIVMLQGDDSASPRVYDAASAAVLSSTGERIDFYSAAGSLNGSGGKGAGYLLFGLNPSLFLRKGSNDRIRWNIGLRFAMQSINTTDGDVNGTYFVRGEDTSRAALSSLTNSKYQNYVGFFIGVNLK